MDAATIHQLTPEQAQKILSRCSKYDRWLAVYGTKTKHYFIKLSGCAIGARGLALCGRRLIEHDRRDWENILITRHCQRCEANLALLQAKARGEGT